MPDKWNKTDRLPCVGDIVLFIFTDGNKSKDANDWRLGKVRSVVNRRVEIGYAHRGDTSQAHKLLTLTRSPRSIAIVHSVDDLLLNTVDHYKNVSKQ